VQRCALALSRAVQLTSSSLSNLTPVLHLKRVAPPSMNPNQTVKIRSSPIAAWRRSAVHMPELPPRHQQPRIHSANSRGAARPSSAAKEMRCFFNRRRCLSLPLPSFQIQQLQ
jgi:hypothetical protein